MIAPPAYGNVTLTSIRDQSGNLTAVRCDHADARIGISGPLLAQWHVEAGAEWLSRFLSIRHADTCPIGDIITMTCVNRRLVYRVLSAEPVWLEGDVPLTYIAEWPD